MSNAPDWATFQNQFLRYDQPSLSLDYSRMGVGENFLAEHGELVKNAIADMEKLEAGGEVNTHEERMVGHYWLRNSTMAPTVKVENKDGEMVEEDLSVTIENDIKAVKDFASEVHAGKVAAPAGQFDHILLIGIGGSALGPQLVSDALAVDGMTISFFDNTDPAGIDATLEAISDRLPTTLAIVVSKSGGTPETRNGMLEAEAGFAARGLDFSKQAVAVTGEKSNLDAFAKSNGWLKQFYMHDWIGGRTSVMSTVGLLPAALQGLDIDQFLDGAAAMDEKTRNPDASQNAAMLLALMWHHAGDGKGKKDMVVLPYKDSLVLFSKYLQQLVMESLGKTIEVEGEEDKYQGIAVYGNKGSTDQHAYVQQLRDGLPNFFATFIEVRNDRSGASIDVSKKGTPEEEQANPTPPVTSGDFLQGFLRGTRSALAENGRGSITISIPEVDAYNLGTLIALFERAVSFYASFVNINAYHQPGVEAGKKAAGDFLKTLVKVREHLAENSGSALGAEEVATAIGSSDPEEVFHILTHLAATYEAVTSVQGNSLADDQFTHA